MVAAAVVGGAAISAGGSLLAGSQQASGAKAAARASERATEASIAEQRRQFDLTRGDFAPYREVGTNALYAYANLFGVPTGQENASAAPAAAPQPQFPTTRPGATSPVTNQNATPWGMQDAQGNQIVELDNGAVGWFDQFTGRFNHLDFNGEDGEAQLFPTTLQRSPAAPQQQQQTIAPTTGDGTDADPYGGFRETPGYQFAFDEGMRALDRSAAARGGLRGGGHSRELTRYGQGIADQEFNTYANRLASLAGIGQSATTSGAAFGQQSANSISGSLMSGAVTQGNALQNAATARASGYAGVGNAVSGGVSNYLLYSALQGS